MSNFDFAETLRRTCERIEIKYGNGVKFREVWVSPECYAQVIEERETDRRFMPDNSTFKDLVFVYRGKSIPLKTDEFCAWMHLVWERPGGQHTHNCDKCGGPCTSIKGCQYCGYVGEVP